VDSIHTVLNDAVFYWLVGLVLLYIFFGDLLLRKKKEWQDQDGTKSRIGWSGKLLGSVIALIFLAALMAAKIEFLSWLHK
jgi:hypothetical protein